MSWHTLDALWQGATARTLMGAAGLTTSRDGAVAGEVCGDSLKLQDLRQVWMTGAREASPLYGPGEFMWYLSGSDDGEFIMHYAKGYERFLNDGYAAGAYGPRWRGIEGFDPLAHVIHELAMRPATRQAVIPIYAERDLESAGDGVTKDIPCTLGIQFLIRSGQLNMIVTMRSNDVWLGLPYDMFCFGILARLVADELKVRTGWYIHQPGSLHLYSRNLDAARKAVYTKTPTAPVWMDWWVPRPPGSLMNDVSTAIALEVAAREDDIKLTEFARLVKKRLGENSLLGTIVTLCHANGRVYTPDDAVLLASLVPMPIVASVAKWQGIQAGRLA